MRLIAVALLLATVACQPRIQPGREIALPSGKKVTAMAVNRVNLANNVVALRLRYLTNLSLFDSAGLREEVEEIWPLFKPDVEREGYVDAVIIAGDAPRGGFPKTVNGVDFVYKRSADGTWQFVGNGKSN